jgi:hypothetical protein
MALPTNLHALDADALRQLLIAQDRELTWRQTKIDQLTHELSLHNAGASASRRSACRWSRPSCSRRRSKRTWRR